MLYQYMVYSKCWNAKKFCVTSSLRYSIDIESARVFWLVSIVEVSQQSLQHGSDPNFFLSVQLSEYPCISNILYFEML